MSLQAVDTVDDRERPLSPQTRPLELAAGTWTSPPSLISSLWLSPEIMRNALVT